MSTKLLIADYRNSRQGKHIIALMDRYAEDPMGGGKPLSDRVRNRLINALAARPNAFTVLCYVEDEPAGLINCFEGFSTFRCKPLVNVHDVIVMPKHRGKGLSTLMLHRVEEIARQRGSCKLTLEVLSGNDVAQAAYKGFGFRDFQLDPELGHALFWEKEL